MQVDPAKLAAHNVSLQQVIDTAGNAQLVSPLTYLEGSAPGTGGFLDGPNQRIDIRPVLPLGAPKNLASVPITDAPGRLPLGSVANIVRGHQPLIGNGITRYGTGLVLLVQKLPSASVPGVTAGVMNALSDLRPALPGVTVDTSFFRPATYVHDSLHNSALALVLAAVLGIVALVALLLDLRGVFLAAISVALSLGTAVIIIDALGYTLNALVVLGLLVALLVIVDDAVGATLVLLGRVRLRREQNLAVPLQTVIVEGIAELRGMLGYATLIGLLAIAPVFFAKGLTATYVHPMALTFALSVITSALVVTILTPALGMVLFDRGRTRARAARMKQQPVKARYGALVQRTFAIPRAVLLAVCLLGFAGAIAFPFLNQPSSPRFKDRNVVVGWTGPSGAGLGEMEPHHVTRAGGPAGPALGVRRRDARPRGQRRPYRRHQLRSDLRPDQVERRLRPGVRRDPGDCEQRAGHLRDGLDAGGQRSGRRVRGTGQGPADAGLRRGLIQLHALGTQIGRLMAQLNGIGQPQVTAPAVEPNVNVAIDDTKAHDAGVLPGDARRQASTLVSGLTVGFFEQQAVFDAVVWSIPSVRQNLQDVRNLPIDTSGGGHVPLSSIASVTVGPHPVDIQHQSLSRYVDVSAPLYVGTVADAQSALQHKMSQVSFPQGYHAEVLGGTPEDRRT